MSRLLLSIALLLLAGSALAATERFTVVTIDTAKDELQLFLGDEQGKPFHGFKRLDAWLAGQGVRLDFAMNAGMYHPDFRPVGLLVIDGKEVAPLNLDPGVGNFFLQPNGVFFVGADGPRVVESSEYPALSKGVRIASQSGPLLLRNGVIHRAFKPDSTSRHIRNGVGVIGSKAVFVISEFPVTFHEFAVFMRDTLGCRDALYFDGTISSLYDKSLRRHDAYGVLGPIIGTTRPLASGKPAKQALQSTYE